MNNYLIKIEYDGNKFVGWQYQKNGTSVQEKIEKALSKYLKKNIRIYGAGRTDKGVHAVGQFANFKLNEKIKDTNKFLSGINFFLAKTFISIIEIKKKNLDFNARHSAKERIYEYIIVNRYANLTFYNNRAWHVKKKLNIALLKKGAKILEGIHDFSTFRASTCYSKSPIKKMNSVKIKKLGDKILITFKSKSFLQNQVRSMVGCLKYLAVNKWDLKKFKFIFKSKNRRLCAPPAPANGLYLKNVVY